MNVARALALLLTIGVGAPARAEEAVALPPGSPNLVTIVGAEGIPDDATERVAFWRTFRSTFMEQGFVTEKPSAREGRFAVSVPLINRVVLLEGETGPLDADTYRVRLGIEWLPDPAPRTPSKGRKAGRTGSSKGATSKDTVPSKAAIANDATSVRAFVSVLAIPPGVDPDLVRLAGARDTIAFATPRAPRAVFLASVARNAAFLVLEHVHRLAGELPEAERLTLDHATRVASAPAAPRR